MSTLSCKIVRFIAVLVGFVTLTLHAGPTDTTLVNINPDKNGQPWLVGGLPPLTPEVEARWAQLPKMFGIRTFNQLPSLKFAVDNSTLGFFPPVFTQTGGSCAQASGIGYIFTYELAAARSADASQSVHRYPEHFTWNFLNRGSASGSWQNDGWDIAQQIGIPNIETYGGMSSPRPYTQWMTGYDNYYQAMTNRTERTRRLGHFSSSDIESIKAWLDHRGIGASIGGVAGFSAFITDATIRKLPNNQNIITRFSADGGHSMTIVGYDDTVKIDINNDGQMTTDIDITGDGIVDIRDSEVGAFRIANTWGESWLDNGFAWVPYSTFALPNRQGGIYANSVQVIDVIPSYTPDYALKVTLTHPNRGSMRLTAGVASTTSATVPERQKTFTAFDFKGGNHPVRGDSEEAIELGLDITDLMNEFGADQVAKVFLIIQDKADLYYSTAQIQSLSLMDYSGDFLVEIQGDSNVAIVHGVNGNTASTYAAVNLQFECEQFTATLSQHQAAGRAYTKSTTSWWTTTKTWYAVGSDELLGTTATKSVTLHQESQNVFRTGGCPVPDTNAPVITLLGEDSIEVIQGSLFVDPGVTAMDDRDGDISDKVTVIGAVETQTIGTYYLIYNVADLAGNAAEAVERTVHVIAAPACQEFTSTVAQHESAMRAYSTTTTSWWNQTKTWYAQGSDENLGTTGAATKTLREMPVGSGVFEQGTCPTEPLPPQPPVITYADVSVAGTTVTVTGAATGDNDLKSVVLYFAGGGVACDVDNPIGETGNFSYNCTDMSNWSFVITDMEIGVYDCQESNGCIAVAAHDIEMQSSELEILSFTVTGETSPECFTATNTVHAQAQRAVLKYNVLYYSVGGSDYLGLGTESTSLSLDAAGVWKKVNSCPN